MGGKIDSSHGLRPLGTVSTHAPEKADKAGDKKKPGEADAKADAKTDPKGWKAAQAPQANAHKPALAQGADPKPLKELTSNLATLKQAAEVPGRFASDLEAARPELVNHPALLRADKAQRLFEFAVPYTQAAVTKSTTPEEKHEVAGEFLIRAEQGGYGLLQPRDAQDPLARNGLAALREMLEAQTPEQVAERAATHRFDIPSWPSDAAMLAEARAAATDQQLQPQPLTPSGAPVAPPTPEEEEQARRDRNTNKRLGGRMLWNVLHLFRDDGEDDRESAEQREAKAQAFLIAGLVFVLLAVIVVAFVSM
jgi:hypothetical protein